MLAHRLFYVICPLQGLYVVVLDIPRDIVLIPRGKPLGFVILPLQGIRNPIGV